jgi:hypothetical protein
MAEKISNDVNIGKNIGKWEHLYIARKFLLFGEQLGNTC